MAQNLCRLPSLRSLNSINNSQSTALAMKALPAAMRHFGHSSLQRTAPAATASRSSKPAPLALPSKMALDSFFVQHAPLNDPSVASAPRSGSSPWAAPQKANKDMQMDQLASIFGGFVPFRTPAPPGHRAGQPKWERMTLRGAEMPDGSSLLPDVLQAREPSLQLPAAEEPSAEELQMAREVIQAARLWANIKKIRHQKIKKHKLQKLRKRDRILRKQK